MYKGISKTVSDIKEGYIYCCFKGNNVDGHDFIEQALENGASKILGTKNLNMDNYEKVDDINEAMIRYSKLIYDNPQESIELIGITGTDGKTSTALIIDNLLNKITTCSYLGTNGLYINGKEEEYSGFTTPFADILYENLNKAVKKNSKNFVMEVSSHALKQGRVNGLKYKNAIFTNLTAEHLDFHKTFEDYYESKKLIFNLLDESGVGIINIDDEYGYKLLGELKNVKVNTVSKTDSNADFYISDMKLNVDGTTFNLTIKKLNKTFQIKSPLLAEFNIYNLVQAIASILNLGFTIENILPHINSLYIPGRLEIIKNKRNLKIIIDFAHTAEAINKVMTYINKINDSNSKIHVLTGSAGQRDFEKRPLMGEYSAMYADYLYLTEDDPRDEDVSKIINDLKKGIKNKECEIFEIEDRKEAIKKMINNSDENDVLVLFGKGAMKVMYYDGYTVPYIEKEIIKEILNEG